MRMSKILSMSVFFVLNYTLFLCGAEQQIITLYKEITIPADVTAISFCKNQLLMAYASRSANDSKTTVAVVDTREDHKCESAQVDGNVNTLCFNDRAWYVGMLTNNGVVLVDWQNPPVTIENQENSFYSALKFNEGHCYAGTSIGQLFKLQENRSAELVYSMPRGDYISSIAFDDVYKRVGLAGKSVTEQGLFIVINEDNSSHIEYGGSDKPMTQSCFDSSGLLYAVATGQRLVIDNMEQAESFVHPKWFEYSSPVTQLCFDGTDKRLFVGLENGKVYLSDLKDAGDRKNPGLDSTLLLQWEHPIQALSFNAAENMLGIATLYKAALFKYLTRQ